MPELPEVETVRVGLEKWVGRAARSAPSRCSGARTLRRYPPGPADFVGSAGRTPGRVARGGAASSSGCRSTTARTCSPTSACPGSSSRSTPGTPDGPHLRARFGFDDGGLELRFVDQRTFGGLSLDDGGETADGVPAVLAHVAPDPFEPAFDPAAFAAALRRRRTGVKRAILDQTLISGVGNIYADEALWRAKLHYARATDRLRRPEVDRLLEAIRDVSWPRIAAGGTSFDALYVAVNGESGWFDRSLEVYGREGEPCSRCGTPIVREQFTNRSSYLCPKCQPRPRSGRW